MRLLLIEDSDADRSRIVAQLREALPDAEVEQWVPKSRGKPPRDFDWKRYDALLLSDAPGGDDGIEWLSEFRRYGKPPPTLIMAGTGSEDLAVRAVKAGASDFLRKAEVTGDRLALALREALLDSERSSRTGDTQTRTQPLDISAIGTPARRNAARIRGYQVLRKIGEGGMAKVYLAEREETRLQLVLKVLDKKLLADDDFLKRFRRECRIISKMQNEHVVAIYDHGVNDDCAFLAMEYFEGGDLKARIRQGISSIQALKILVQIAKALEAVHSAGVVHRDLKPQNIMFREGNRLALVDFGLAKEVDAKTTLTHAGIVLATPLYMSPEQYQGGRQDQRSDLYSVGVILYEMLTGKPPFTAGNAPALAYQHVNSPVPRLPQRLSGYQGIVDKLMAKQPEDRFQSARELFAYIAH
jgi:tRNA A-37 threonylcarbamoyl transferase component Bud32/DNA-binding NarL/FixJ family response regulator